MDASSAPVAFDNNPNHGTKRTIHEILNELPDPSDLNGRVELEVIKKLYKAAEDMIATVQSHIGESADASINQLRYAGHHVLHSVTSDCEDKRHEELRKAGRHCMRSIYDSCDWGLMRHLDEFKEFKANYQRVNIVQVVPDYVKIRRQATKAVNLIDAARASGEQRLEFYKDTAKYYEALMHTMDELAEAEDELKKLLNDRYDRRFRWFIGIGIALLGTLLTVIGIGLSILVGP